MGADGPDESRHIGVWINRPADVVYRYAADPAHLPQWAAGLALGDVARVDDHWVVQSPRGRVTLRLVTANELGVLDHTVTADGTDPVFNPMRVLPAGPDWCEVVFTLRRHGMSQADFQADASAVAADLAALKRLLEATPTPPPDC